MISAPASLSSIVAATLLCVPFADAHSVSSVEIISGGRSDWRIECSVRDRPALRFAAGELQTNLRRISRCELPIVDRVSPHPALVVAVRKDLSAEDQAILPPPAKGYDGYTVVVRAARGGASGRIIIAGENDRGAIYGVYDLLERFGCRWFYPTKDPRDPEVVPKRSTVVMAAGSWAVASPFKFRICCGSDWLFQIDYKAAAKQLDWAMKNRYNVMSWQSEAKTSPVAQYQRMQSNGLIDELSKRNMLLHGPGHCFDQLLRADDYMAEHPEWFGIRGGKRVPQTFLGAQFCWSNVEARRQFAENAAAFVKACPVLSIFFLAPFDGGPCCDCPDCRKAGASDLLMTLTGEVIQRLQRESPHVLVETLGGYGAVAAPPSAANVNSKTRVIWAHWGRYHGMSYGDSRYQERANLEAWRHAARGGLNVCQYYCDNFCQPWIMPPFANTIQGDRKYLIEKQIDSVTVLMWPPGYWWNHGLNGYLAGRCFYDASLDPFRELRDYAMRYFGSDAGPALAAYCRQWARELDLAYHIRNGATDADVVMLDAERRQWLKPAMNSVRIDSLEAHRIGKVEKLHAFAERLAQLSRKKDEVRQLREKGQVDRAKIRLEELRRSTEEVLKLGHSLADLHQGLIDGKEIDGWMAMILRGRIAEEAKLLEKKPLP
jgi:hypothetical protein